MGEGMPSICVANAPCSWGTLEFEGISGESPGYRQMLDELKATGFVGTELGDWGYMPTNAGVLRQELTARGLSLRGAFVPVALSDAGSHAAGIAQAVRTARLLSAAGDAADPPVLVLADANGTDAVRTRNAGRITPAMGLASADWEVVARGATKVAQAVVSETGLQTVLHHHCAGFVETPRRLHAFLTEPTQATSGSYLIRGTTRLVRDRAAASSRELSVSRSESRTYTSRIAIAT